MRKRFAIRQRTCFFCDSGIDHIDYKNPKLQDFLNDRGKIVPSKLSGVCSRHQRLLARAIKVARNLALLPYSAAR